MKLFDMTLRDLLATLPDLSLPQQPASQHPVSQHPVSQHPALDQKVTGLATNSHACQPGDLFIGMPGTRVDGGEFWSGAIAAGAIAALISPSAAQKAPRSEHQNPCLITYADLPRACAQIATAFYGNPGQKMSLVGVTGTNGKTTTTHLIEFLLNQTQQPTALFGTLYSRWAGHQQTAAHTTPFVPELQAQLSEAVDAGCQYAVMEVSSHALAQGRVWGCPFEVAVFTNLTQDHLDYHKDLDDYFEAKALLFNSDYLKGRAIINRDDVYGRQLIDRLPPDRVWTYSLGKASLENTAAAHTAADLWTSDLVYGSEGVQGILHTPRGSVAFQSPLVGQFNLANLLAAVGAALHLGLDLEAIAQALPQFTGVPGRMEQVQIQPEQDISVIVDYAHTPDSLENLLSAARPFISGRMICVFGCGGDRDRTKRPLMGEIAARLSDWAIVTSDNPRTEDPERILQDIQAGIPAHVNATVISDRAEAIRLAILEAKSGDGVLIAGKGHEDYQILGTEKVHFDDREQSRQALMQRLSHLI